MKMAIAAEHGKMGRRWGLALALCVAGCGGAGGIRAGDGGGGGAGDLVVLGALDCSPVNPCGGDLVGSWKRRGSCPSNTFCPAKTSDSSQVTLLLTFDGAMVTLAASGTGTVSYPLSCFQTDAGAISCGQLGVGSGTTCNMTMSSCDCTIDFAKALSAVKPAPYSTANGQLTIGSGPGAGHAAYCITGDVLRLASSPGMPGGVAEFDRH